MIKNCEMTAERLPGLDTVRNKPETVCPVQMALEVAETAHMASCGRGTFCRDGLTQLVLIIRDITQDKGSMEDIELLRDLCDTIVLAGDCELCVRAAELVRESMVCYADEWAAHITRKRCSAMKCDPFYNVYIDPATCNGCGACRKNAPEGAIAGGDGMIHVVKNDRDIKGDTFAALCPVQAIRRCGVARPPLPAEPIPVGTFGSGAEGGGRRRRRG